MEGEGRKEGRKDGRKDGSKAAFGALIFEETTLPLEQEAAGPEGGKKGEERKDGRKVKEGRMEG